MAAPLSLSRATITQGDRSWEDVSIVIRRNLMTVKKPDRSLAFEPAVVASTTSEGGGKWLIEFDEGEPMQVVRRRGCGCGG